MATLTALLDQQLSSVEFVQDYLQLHFDGPSLSLFQWPQLADSDGISIAFGEPGYRDALCSVLTETVSKAELAEEDALTIEFENGTVLALSLREEDRDMTEVGHFAVPGEALVVF